MNDGGPAFPIVNSGNPEGMSLRDWFAGQVLLAILPTAVSGDMGLYTVEQYAYKMADKMLSMRAQPDIVPKK